MEERDELRVLLLQNRPGSLRKVRAYLDLCRTQFSFLLDEAALEKQGIDRQAEGRAVLAFVEAPRKLEETFSRHDPLWQVLEALTARAEQGQFIRAFVVSTADEFQSQEAQRAWLDYPIVVGYEVQGGEDLPESGAEAGGDTASMRPRGLRVEDVRRVVEETVGRVAANIVLDPADLRPVGSRLRMPLGPGEDRSPQTVREAYRQHRFASFLTGGMSEALMLLREAREAIAERSPRPHYKDGRLCFETGGSSPTIPHPFEGGSAQACFDQVMQALYGDPDGPAADGPDALPVPLRQLEDHWQPPQIPPHVLLLGETGTGKTLLARWLHRSRFRSDEVSDPQVLRLLDALFQDLNCGAIPGELVETELFGGKAGAYTDLRANVPGAIFSACLGTLFLDEIGELPLGVQGVLLKYLDNFHLYPVGARARSLFIPTVVIAATNRPLGSLVQEGCFRRDLYERFRFRIRLPSLKERADYLSELIDFVLQNPEINPIRIEAGEVVRRVSFIHRAATRKLRSHPWPGNFRELEQVLWRAVLKAGSEGVDRLMPHHVLFSSDPDS